MRVLFVTPALPWPPRKGYQVRAARQLGLLGRRHRISLVAVVDRPPGAEALASARACCADLTLVPQAGVLARAGALARGLRDGRPLQVSLHDTAALRRTLRDRLAAGGYDVVHVQLARMAGALDGEERRVRGVLDLVDALSLNMRRRAARDPSPAGWAAAFEARRLHRYERELCAAWGRVTVAAETDRAAIGDFPNLAVNPNGVELELFACGAGSRAAGPIVFTGNLGYFPNVDAVGWFAGEVLPLIWSEEPAVRFTAAGARPARALLRLARADRRIEVAGDVPSLVPHLQAARVAVVPLHAGSGHPLKVLEGLACGAPVVATTLAAQGIGAIDGVHLLVADTPGEFARAVLRLLREPVLGAALAAAGRRLVEERHGWEVSVAGLERLWEEAAARR